MENIERHNLKLTGNGSAAGGEYNTVSITGEETINGDLDCIRLKLTGNCDIHGNVKVNKSKMTGTSAIKGNLEAEEFKVVGTVFIDGNASVKNLGGTGEFKVKGNMEVENVDLFGFLDINGNCSSDTFRFKGPFKIGGLLNAESINLEVHSKCHVKEIGGEKIKVQRGSDMILKKLVKSIFLPNDFYLGVLIADTVEGDEIYLEYTKAKVVRGVNVTIGPGCEIDLVEFKNNFEQADGTLIKQNRKM